VSKISSIKRSRLISLALISSMTLLSCAEEQYRTQRALYANRAECEKEWGTGDTRCYSNNGVFYGPHFLFIGGRSFIYPYQSGGVASTTPVVAPASAAFSSNGAFKGSGVVTSGISRGGFGARGGFGGGFGG
jgi:hypothetical protein